MNDEQCRIRSSAPKGAATSLIDRVLTEAGERGATVADILAAAIEAERPAVGTVFRLLRTGLAAARYRKDGDVWFLVNQ